MEHILKNGSDYIIGLTSIIITIVVSITIYRRQRKFKGLNYEILLNDTLLKIKEDLGGKLSVLFDGKSADNISLLILNFSSNGNEPILKSDFEESIRIQFADTCKPLNIDILDKKPSNIDLKMEIKDNNILIYPCLLNPKDNFTIRIILDTQATNIKVLSRIAGLKKIVEVDSTTKIEPIVRKNLPFLISISICLGLFGYMSIREMLPIEVRNNFMELLFQISAGITFSSIVFLVFEKGRLSFTNKS